MVAESPPNLQRLNVAQSSRVRISVDGQALVARSGETVLTALRLGPGHVHMFEFGAEKRAGFCLMGACQDCWLWLDDGSRRRACTTRVEDGMTLTTMAPVRI